MNDWAGGHDRIRDEAGDEIHVAEAGSGGAFLVVDLTADQLIHLHSAPVQILPAPGAGKFIFPVVGVLQSIPGSRPFGAGLVIVVTTPDGDRSHPYLSVQVDFDTAGLHSVSSDEGPTTAQADNAPLVVSIDADVDVPDIGPILTSSLVAAGAGYLAGDACVDPGHGATAQVDTVDENGVILTYHVTDPGDGYSVANSSYLGLTGGSGNGGFAISVDSVTPDPPGNGTARLTVWYAVVDLA